MMPSPTNVTQLLLAWEEGDDGALDRLMPLVSDALHQRARRFMRQERAGHTLQPTALVNEVYLRLVDQKQIHWQSRAHFLAVAARIMRHILVDHARRHRAAKRGADAVKVPLQEADAITHKNDVDLITLDQALATLATFAPRQGRIVELRFFGGLTIEETAHVLEVSPATVKVDWKMAKAWLYEQLK